MVRCFVKVDRKGSAKLAQSLNAICQCSNLVQSNGLLAAYAGPRIGSTGTEPTLAVVSESIEATMLACRKDGAMNKHSRQVSYLSAASVLLVHALLCDVVRGTPGHSILLQQSRSDSPLS